MKSHQGNEGDREASGGGRKSSCQLWKPREASVWRKLTGWRRVRGCQKLKETRWMWQLPRGNCLSREQFPSRREAWSPDGWHYWVRGKWGTRGCSLKGFLSRKKNCSENEMGSGLFCTLPFTSELRGSMFPEKVLSEYVGDWDGSREQLAVTPNLQADREENQEKGVNSGEKHVQCASVWSSYWKGRWVGRPRSGRTPVTFQNSRIKRKIPKITSRRKSRYSYEKTSRRQYWIPAGSVKIIFKLQWEKDVLTLNF